MTRFREALIRSVVGTVLHFRTLQGLVALACIVLGVVFIFWPAALIVAGVLLVFDRMTTPPKRG